MKAGYQLKNNLTMSRFELRSHYLEFLNLLAEKKNVIMRDLEKIKNNCSDEGFLLIREERFNYSNHHIPLSLSQRKHLTLIEIRNALERMRNGIFGICEECEEVISIERLRNVPYVRYCIECQKNIENL